MAQMEIRVDANELKRFTTEVFICAGMPPDDAAIEADRAFGPVVTTMAMNRVIDKASTVGIGWDCDGVQPTQYGSLRCQSRRRA